MPRSGRVRTSRPASIPKAIRRPRTACAVRPMRYAAVGTTSSPMRGVHEGVGEDNGQHRQRPGGRHVDPAGDLRRPHGHGRRQRDGQDAEAEHRAQLARHAADPGGQGQQQDVQRRGGGVGLLRRDHSPMEVLGDVAGVAQRDVGVVDQAPVCDVHDNHADERTGDGPPQVPAAAVGALRGRVVLGDRAQIFGRGHRRGVYGARATVVACLTGSKWRPGKSCNGPSRRLWQPRAPSLDSSRGIFTPSCSPPSAS